jgi:hypothetical protein
MKLAARKPHEACHLVFCSQREYLAIPLSHSSGKAANLVEKLREKRLLNIPHNLSTDFTGDVQNNTEGYPLSVTL